MLGHEFIHTKKRGQILDQKFIHGNILGIILLFIILRKKNMGTVIKPISIDQIYVSVLQAQRVVGDDGREYLEPVDKQVPQTGSIIMDAVAVILATTTESEVAGFARRMDVRPQDLTGAIRILTGMLPLEFFKLYRMRQIKEWLACTDLPISEIARRSPFSGLAALSKHFIKEEHMSPKDYRHKNRPRNFRELYRW